MGGRAAAGPEVPNNIPAMQLRRATSLKGHPCNFSDGCFMTIEEIAPLLLDSRIPNKTEARMLEILGYLSFHHFPHTQVPLPVSSLQHVTEEAALNGIVGQECFKITKRPEERSEFHDLIFWSAGISPPDVEKAREKMYEAVRRVISTGDAYLCGDEIKEQFANSPAFNESASSYGNFRFSFPLAYLLDLYKAQHCDGEEPQLRILGTELHKQEIAHYIVVHSPHTNKYGDLPIVPSSPEYLVYRDGETLYWRPESTSVKLTVKISEHGQVQNGWLQYCVWNQLIFAFHLPDGGQLDIPRVQLVHQDHLTSCEGCKPRLGYNYLTKEEAEEVIQGLRQQYNLHEAEPVL